MRWEVQEVHAKWNWEEEGEGDKGVGLSASMDQVSRVSRPPNKVRLGWGESLWPMTLGPRSGKTKTQFG